MSLSRRGLPVGRYLIYVVLLWLWRDVIRYTHGVPLCPQEEGDYTVLLDSHDMCIPGDTCETSCTPQDKNFQCTIHNETGWRRYETHYQTDHFSLTNENGPELVAISMHHKWENNTGITYFRPALSLSINISAEILGTPAINPPNPEALLVRMSGVNDSDSVRDDFYIDTPLYRLFSFRNYTPTSRDKEYPRQAILKCIDISDACSVKVYRLEITAFIPFIRFMTRTVYTVTAPNNRSQSVPPVIATALHPRDGSVTVVFETSRGPRVTTVALVRVSQTLASKNPERKIEGVLPGINSVRFRSVRPGLYTAMLEIEGSNYHSHPFCVGKFEQPEDECLKTFYKSEASIFTDINEPIREPSYIIPMLVAFLFLLIVCIGVALVLYLNRYRLTRLIKHNHQTPTVEKVIWILLLNRERDQHMAQYLTDFADEHFPWVKFVHVEDQEMETNIPSNTWMEKTVKSCDHIIVIWSPPDAEEDIFAETLRNGCIFNNNADLCVIFSSGGFENSSIPVEFNRARKFDLATELEAFCQHCFSQSFRSSESKQDFQSSPSYKTMVESYTTKSHPSTKQDEFETELLLEHFDSCPVHGIKGMQDTNFNIVRDDKEDCHSEIIAYMNCPIHGIYAQSQSGCSLEYNSRQDSFSGYHSYEEQSHHPNSSIESRFFSLNSGS